MTAVAFDPAFVERIASARPAEMTAMLLEEAIKSLQEAREAAITGAVEHRFLASARAMKIVGFLHETLNFDEGGDVAVNLERLYRLTMARIARINPFNDGESALAAVRMLKPQADAWRRIDADEAADLPEIEALPGIAAQTARQAAYAS